MLQIVFASSNTGKIKELNELVKPLNIKVLPQSEFNVPDVEETGLTFVENAILKARHCAQYTSLPVIADDSGLVIKYLHGAPGIYSARYSGKHGDSQANIKRVLDELEGVEDLHRQAYFHCSLVLMKHQKDPDPLITQGHWYGKILTKPQGEEGFGYDPIFYVPTHLMSAAELAPEVKNTISHRAQALAKLLEQI
ncbi:RdgB/HAM1 family non-canonical purine NTP pyrophosphatase [Thiotrichales bacterium 19S3-7]|nr:RdgB/HAM1 family non-canonical purine NTP pyrophosphatase [Thiotrichales bacterium 19S3-7]MCF6802934.1 RdgB/HAM1 family non-canonical purine NTP pyrophosphatase [Thiotrichales bacterium 19S3-11]